MSMWGEVFESLQAMSAWQLLFAFCACTGYAIAQGRLVGPRAKDVAMASTVLSVVGFVLGADRWVDGIVLVAVAVAGMGLFTALVWLVSNLLGMGATAASPRVADALSSVLPADAEGAVGHGQAIPAARRTAPSH